MSVRTDLRSLAGARGFLRLLWVRVATSFADGALQAGLATLFFFSPQSASTPGGVAAAYAVLLGPYTLVGPWAGVLLDRWPRRAVLVWTSAVRVVIALALAAMTAGGPIGPAVYVLALVSLSLTRFSLAATSAGLPRLVPEESLLTANSVSAPLGSVATLLGGLVGLATTVGLGDGWRWVCLVVAALGAGIGAALAAGFRADALGPDRPTESMGAAFRGYFGGLRDAAVSLWRTRGPAAALGAMAAARLAFGLVMMAAILITRNLLHPGDVGAALATFTVVLGVSAAGFAAAAILTPLAHARFSPRAWTVVSLGLAAASGLVLATSSALPVLLAGAFLLSLGVQNAKLAADTIVQQGVADDIRGWAFSIYDMLFNGALVLAAAIGALVLPATGYSVPLFLAVAAFYALTAWAYGAVSRQRT